MPETLAKGFRSARQRFTGVAELTDDVIDEALRDVRMSLLEADVEFRVTKRFLERVKEKARGERIKLKAKSKEYGVKTITPEQAFVAICQEELTSMMGPVDTDLRWAKKGATGIMMVGLQGSGKTTTTGKLARYLEREHKKKPLLVAADVYRPAAVEQLKTLGGQLGMPVFSIEGGNPVDICSKAGDYALEQGFESVATGHYARRRELSNGQAAVLKGADPNKDQSYFLALMTQRQVSHALFPVGEMLKPEVREVARRHDL
ncbi:MAG: signal recognition particle receptor subunit alpha, partial [Myxococcota bacterium]